MEWEVGVSRCKLLYIGWINNKVLLHSTENYIHYPMINHSIKEYNKRMCIYTYMCIYVCLYVELNHFAVHQKLTHIVNSTILQKEISQLL